MFASAQHNAATSSLPNRSIAARIAEQIFSIFPAHQRLFCAFGELIHKPINKLIFHANRAVVLYIENKLINSKLVFKLSVVVDFAVSMSIFTCWCFVTIHSSSARSAELFDLKQNNATRRRRRSTRTHSRRDDANGDGGERENVKCKLKI